MALSKLTVQANLSFSERLARNSQPKVLDNPPLHLATFQTGCSSQVVDSSTLEAQQSQVWYGQGVSLLRLGYYQEAIACFDRAIALTSTFPEAWHRRGDALANLTRYEEALASFDKALEFAPNWYEIWTFRGVVLLHLNRCTAALASCNRALGLNPDHEEAWIFRGAALQKLCRYQEAYTSYRNALGYRRKPWWQRLTDLFAPLQRVLSASKTVHCCD